MLALFATPGSTQRQEALRAAGGVELQRSIFRARDQVLPALVNVQPVVRDFSSGTKEKQRVTGSGVVVRREGYVVTNYHVAGQSEYVICTLWNKERVRAELIGGDPLTDLAVLKLDYSEYEGERPPAATFGDSEALETGQLVMALGSPFALSRSLSFGVISTTDRYLSSEFRLPSGERTGIFNTWIQTDAAINPGNSGGPLVDLQGRVIGINTRAFMLANNLGFSIPANVAKGVVSAIISDGRVERSWIGVEVQPLQELEEFFDAHAGGVLVSDVEPDSPAMLAGLRAGDLLLAVDGQDVSARFYEEIPGFYSAIASLDIGRKIEIEYQRNGRVHELSLDTQAYGRPSGVDFEVKEWGFAVRSITKQMALERRLESQRGVLVAGVKSGGPAEAAGLSPLDIVRYVGETPVEDLDSFRRLYGSLADSGEARIMMTVDRRDSSRFVLLKIGNGEG
jgi:serine protease Do